MSEATLHEDADSIDVVVPAAGYASGEVIQLSDGRAAVRDGLRALVEGDQASLRTAGQFTLAKTASVVILAGDLVYWDRSANTATPLRAVAGADFPAGTAVMDAASADTTVVVDLNKRPVYAVDLLHEPTDSATVLTAATNVVNIVQPGCIRMALGTTHAEANKVDHLSQGSVPVTIPFIVEGSMAIYDIGDEASVDINIGIANATHASDADSITESCFLHLDGTALSILAESDDGTTEVAATDTTVDAVDDTWFDFRMDCRDLSDIQIYINGVLVLGSTVFKLDAATGPLKLLAHVEKGANDTPGEIKISHLAIRTTDLAA